MSEYKALNYTCRILCAAFLLVLLFLFTTTAGTGSPKALTIFDAWKAWGFCLVIALAGFFAGCEHKGASA